VSKTGRTKVVLLVVYRKKQHGKSHDLEALMILLLLIIMSPGALQEFFH
jgi:hypothetical protein